MKLALLALALLLPTNWAVKSETQVVVEPRQQPTLIPLEGLRRGDSVRLDVSSVSAVGFGIMALDESSGRPSTNQATCFRERVTQASAECQVPANFAAIAVWDMRTIRIRQNRVTVTLLIPGD